MAEDRAGFRLRPLLNATDAAIVRANLWRAPRGRRAFCKSRRFVRFAEPLEVEDASDDHGDIEFRDNSRAVHLDDEDFVEARNDPETTSGSGAQQ